MKKLVILFSILLSLVIIPGIFAYLGGSPSIVIYPYIAAELVEQNPDPAEPGGVLDLRWHVWNNGSDVLENTQFRVTPRWPFTLVPGQDTIINVGDLGTNNIYGNEELESDATLFYRFIVDSKAPTNDYQLLLEYQSNKYEGWQKLPYYTIRVESNTALLDIESFSTIPERIKPGEEGKLLLKLTNKGGTDLKDIKLVLDLDGGGFVPIGSTNEKLVSYIEKGYSTVVEYQLMATADSIAKEFKTPIDITYKDQANNEYVKNNTLTLLMDTTPDYYVALEDTEIFTKNSKGKIVLSLSNVGQGELKYLTMELLSNGDYEVLGKSSEYLGNLESDDFETADFNVFVYDTKKKNLPLKVRIVYKDNYNTEFTEEKTVEMPLYSKSEAKKYGLIAGSSKTIYFILLILILGAGYYYYKKKYKKDKKKK